MHPLAAAISAQTGVCDLNGCNLTQDLGLLSPQKTANQSSNVFTLSYIYQTHMLIQGIMELL